MLRLADLDPADRIGQLFWVGFEGTAFSPAVASLIRRVRPGGVILFARNIESAKQTRALTDALFRVLPIPLFLALDQEGGRVSRLATIVGPTPSPLALASRPRAPDAVERHAAATCLALRSLGFNVNLAPVLDLSGAGARNGIGDRAFGEDPATVTDLAGRFARVHLRSGVIPVGKHFPGLGGARVDSHLDLPVIQRSRETLERQDLLPYRRLRRVLPIVMVGHGYYPAIQGKRPQPASMSHLVVDLLLRRRMAFRGVVLTDDLLMGAIDSRLEGGSRALEAIVAGNDGLIFCQDESMILAAQEAIRQALERGEIEAKRLRASLRRILALKRQFLVRRRGRFSSGSLARARLLFESLAPAEAAGFDPTARP